MPNPLTDYITTWRGCYLYFSAEFNNLANDMTAAAAQCRAESWSGLAVAFDNMCVHTQNIRSYFMGGSPNIYSAMYNAMHWIDVNWPDGAEVNMDAILNAMLASDFDNLQKFIGIVDAYRVSLWNAPFNADFYAALARGFQIWPQY